MIGDAIAGYFLHDIARYISSAFEGYGANGTEAVAPDPFECFGCINPLSVCFFPEFFVGEVVIEQTRVIMWSAQIVAIFPTVEVAYFLASARFSEPFHEKLPVP